MGQGKKTKQTGVLKHDIIFQDGDSARLPSNGLKAGKGRHNSPKSCFFNLTFSVKSKTVAAPGDEVYLVLNQGQGDQVSILCNNVRIDSYTGSKASLIADCMSQGVVYKGQVLAVRQVGSGFDIRCSVAGFEAVL